MRYMILLIVGGCILCAGCAPIESGVSRGGGTTANPGATAKINLATGTAEFSSNRDDDGGLEGLEITVPKDIKSPVAGTTVKLQKMDFKANASKPRQANSNQIAAMGQFNVDTGNAWSTVIDSAGNIIVPVVRQFKPTPAANDAAATASMLITVAVIIGAIVLLIKIWQWLFPQKDNTTKLLLEVMAAQKASK